MKFRILILLVISLLASDVVLAQKSKSKSKKKPTKDVEVIDFGDDEDSKKDDKTYKSIIIKTSPISFIFGRQPFEIEKEITDYLSLQAGLGLTFLPIINYQNIIGEEIEGLGDYSCESTQWANDECDYYADYTIRKGSVGYMASFSPRLFFGSDGFDGGYIAPMVRFSQRKFEVQKVLEGTPSLERAPNEYQPEKVKSIDFGVQYGYQTIYPKLTFEWFAGVGARISNNLRQDIGRDLDGNYGNGASEFKSRKFRFEAGIRVGFQL